jgi:rod shape determining protein RodA
MAMEHRIDPWLLLAVLAILGASLSVLGAVDPIVGHRLLLRQTTWGVIGLAALWLVGQVRASVLQRVAPMAYVLSLLLLAAVLLVGETRSGTRGWFSFGPASFQPSEVARLGTALMIAAWFARSGRNRLQLLDLPLLAAIVGAPVVLILLEPDLGVALTYLPLIVAALWIGGLRPRVWVVIGLVAIIGAGATWMWGLKPYQKDRILTLVQPERDPYGAGYQVRQSKIAVGSGRLVGQGLGRGSQSALRFLPAQHTDFIFAAWAEGTGFVGTTALLLAYALLLWRVGVTAAEAGERFGIVLATLIAAWLGFQTVVNLGMVVGWLPTTGITLPLMSYGGSSLLTTCIALGMVISIWRHRLVNA